MFSHWCRGLLITGFLLAGCFDETQDPQQKVTMEPSMSRPYYYAYWTISKQQTLPHIVVKDSIGDYESMIDQDEYFIGQDDHLGRLSLSERWVRDRSNVTFPVGDIHLEQDQRRYFVLLDDNQLQEITYSDTLGNKKYLLAYKYVSNFPGQEDQEVVRYELVHQYMYSREEYLYDGDSNKVIDIIRHQLKTQQ